MSVKNQDWHKEDIKAAIRKRGKTLSQLSRDAGLVSNSLRDVLRRHIPKYEFIIADFLREDPATIWPSRYKKCPSEEVV